MSSDDESDAAAIIASSAESSDQEPEAERPEKWSLAEATRPLQYVPLSRNSQLLLMKKLVTRHMWADAADLMQTILTDARHPPLLVFRYGMLVLEHYAPQDDRPLFVQYYKKTMFPFVARFLCRQRREKEKIARAILMGINKKEIVLDVSALLFKHGCDEEIEELYDFLRNQSVNRRIQDYQDRKYRNRIIENCFNGYEAYMRFLKWRKQRKNAHFSHPDEEEDEVDEFSDQDLITMDLLKSVVSSSTDFNVDLFLVSLLEMYQMKGMYEEAVHVTFSHASNRPNDLHAHLRHYDMIDRRIHQLEKSGDSDIIRLAITKTQCFREISRLSPAHPLVRDICDSDDPVLDVETGAPEVENLTERIKLLMNFLDYRANMHDVTAWQMMRALLEELSQADKREFRKFGRFFNSRINDYWENVHFNLKHTNKEDIGIIDSKVAICEIAEVCRKYRKEVRKLRHAVS